MSNPSQVEAEHERGLLSAWDAVSIVFGIVVGTSLFKAPPSVFTFAADPFVGMLLWGLGGLLSLCGAFCYSELVTAYPLLGAEFVFLSKAYGRLAGFLFAWTQIGAILTASVGAMAFVFADYGGRVLPLLSKAPALSAAGAILALAAINLLGLTAGRWTQNALSIAKLVGLGAIVLAGLTASPATMPDDATPSTGMANLGLALVFVLYSYGGWNDASQVATEVRNLERNVPRVLIAGMGGVTILYLIVNAAYLSGLGYAGLCDSKAPAADVVQAAWGSTASSLVSVLVMVSALGAINGMLLAGVRLAAALGREHAILRPLSHWNRNSVAPYALATITFVSLAQVLAVGTSQGRGWIDSCYSTTGLGAFPWEKFGSGFDALVSISAPAFWGFFLLTGIALFVLRFRDPERPRPYRVPFYPWTPLAFLAMCAYMLYSSATYAGQLSLFGLLIALVGAIVFAIDAVLPSRAKP